MAKGSFLLQRNVLQRLLIRTFSIDVIMKCLLLIASVVLFSCSWTTEKDRKGELKMYTEHEILHQLDLAFEGSPSEFYPQGRPQDIKYNFFLDLEHGYCETAGSRIHLYADSTRWAIVFEKSGYQNRSSTAEIELNYVGNCINYPVDKFPERNYISNSSRVILIERAEFAKIENKDGSEMETFELIGKEVKDVKVRDKVVQFESDFRKYEKFGIKVREYDNPKKLIGFGDLVRYLNETDPNLVSAREEDIKEHIPKDITKLMVIDKFHFVSAYDKSRPRSSQQLYKLIAKILVTKDTTNWRPTEKPNNHWANWESGKL